MHKDRLIKEILMRRIGAILASSVLLLVSVPAPAHAWWEVIEQFSGAGPFKGWSMETRFVCFVDPGDGSTDARALSAIELLSGACRLRNDEVRRASIDLGMRFLWADDDPRFANGQRINLTTLAPSISWSIISARRWDFVDFGVAGGVFWFSSTEFPSFSGAFVEPIRLDFHAPSSLKERNPWAAAIPRVRVALLGFPSGFEPAAFAPRPDVAHRIPRDWVKNLGFFTDLEPLLRRLNR
jgi:hypothetical protein